MTLRTGEVQRLSLDGVTTVCCPLFIGPKAAGVLVLWRIARSLPSNGPAGVRPLDTIGPWLARAVQAQLNLLVLNLQADEAEPTAEQLGG